MGIQKFTFILFLMLLCQCAAQAQTKFSASISPEKISIDEYCVLRMVVENGGDIKSITPPSLKDFDIVSGPQKEFGRSTIDNVTTQYTAISYILKPKKPGNFSLAAPTAFVDGKKYNASSLHVFVSKHRSSHQPSHRNPYAALDPFVREVPGEVYRDVILKNGESVPEKVNKSMMMVLHTNKTSVYVGEPVVATYKLYTRLRNETRISRMPSFNGFSVVDMQQPDVTGFNRETYNGKDYNAYTIRKAQLYPLQHGQITIEAAETDNRVYFLKEDAISSNTDISAFLDGYGTEPNAVIVQQVTLSNKPVVITVKPLPEKNKPASFRGAVGNFFVTATLEKNSFTTGEAGKLTVVVSGSGNFPLVTAPEIKWPAGFDAFDAKVSDDISTGTVPLSGRKVFEIPFTVQHAGHYHLPAITFSFFDPSTGIYHSLYTDSLSFDVVKGAGKPLYNEDTIVKRQPASPGAVLNENRHWIIGSLAALILIGLIIFISGENMQRSRKKEMLRKQREAEKLAAMKAAEAAQVSFAINPEPLRKTEDCLNSTDCSAFYTLLNQELKTFFAEQFAMPAQEITAANIIAQMDKAGIDNELTLATQQLMQEIEWQLYAPFERNDTMHHDVFARSQYLVEQVRTAQLTL